MAVDEILLDGYVAGDAVRGPTLRLYGWNPPALSLGRSQRADGAHDPVFLAREGIDLVRRPTGGLAVLHADERTYSVTGRLRSAPFEGRVLETYRRISTALELALSSLGVDARATAAPARARAPQTAACFAALSAHEIAASGRKLVGSAQLRRRDAFLQHGSIPLSGDAGRTGRAVGTSADVLGRAVDLRTAAGREVRTEELDQAIVAAFERVFETRLLLDELTADERERAGARA